MKETSLAKSWRHKCFWSVVSRKWQWLSCGQMAIKEGQMKVEHLKEDKEYKENPPDHKKQWDLSP